MINVTLLLDAMRIRRSRPNAYFFKLRKQNINILYVRIPQQNKNYLSF